MIAALGVIGAALFGALVGSFLNVVIFRLPRGMGISNPRRSICPRCRTEISAIHNVPIVSWLILRGRCATCRAPVSGMYPVVEAVTALAFVLAWDALFIAQTFGGAGDWARDWPLAMGWLALFACLIAVAAMDIESYLIDVQPLCLAMGVGLVSHAAWWLLRDGAMASPFLSGAADGSAGFAASIVPRAFPRNAVDVLPPAICVSACAAGAAWVVTEVVLRLVRGSVGGASATIGQADSDNATADSDASTYLTGGAAGFRPGPVLAVVAATALLMVWQVLEANAVVAA